MLFIHLSFVVISIIVFTGKFMVSVFKPEYLQQKTFKIIPHVVDTFLLVSGISLLVRSQNLADELMWVISKIIILIAYIGLGVLSMRIQGSKRWLAFAGALACYAYIIGIAVTKTGFIYF